jgi:hypothetical protein
MPRAQELIEDGAELFGHAAMAAAVAAQARQDELSAMDAMGAVEQPYHEPGSCGSPAAQSGAVR